MILVHHFVEEVVDIEFRTTIDNGLHLVEQFVEINTLGRGDVIEGDLTVYALDDLHLEHRLLSHRTYSHIHLTLDLVLLAVVTNQIDKLLGVRLFHLSFAHTLDILQFLEGDGIIGGHLFQRYILEDDIRRALQALRHFLTQLTEHSTQRGVEGTDATLLIWHLVVSHELGILHDLEGFGRLQELLSCGRHLQQSVVLDLFQQIACDESLTDNGIPYLLIVVGSSTEVLEVFVVVGDNLVRLLTCDEVDDIVGTEILLDLEDSLQGDNQLVLSLDLRLRMQTVVTVATVILRIGLTEVMKQHLPSTDRSLGIGCRLNKQLTSDILFCHRFALHELIQFLEILIRIESDTETFASVTTCTTCFLVVALQ